MRYHLIANPVAGKGRTMALLPEIEAAFRKSGHEFALTLTEAPGHATTLARNAVDAGFDRIISIGGDGTMGEVVNGVAGSPAALGIIPTGTGNDLCRTLAIPLDAAAATQAAIDPAVRRIDLGKERDGYFAVVVGLGFAADVMHYANTHKWIFQGSFAITASIFATVARLKAQPLRISIDGANHDGPTVAAFVLNTRFVGGGLQMAPNAVEDDGLFDIVLLRDFGRIDLLRTLPKGYKGTHITHPKVEIFRGKHVVIENERPLVKMFDGNILGQTPVEATIVPGVLSVLVPQSEVGKA